MIYNIMMNVPFRIKASFCGGKIEFGDNYMMIMQMKNDDDDVNFHDDVVDENDDDDVDETGFFIPAEKAKCGRQA